MYEHFYTLRERPFELTPNPAYLVLTAGHREALSNLEYGLSAAKSLTVLIGDAGTGKTTVLQTALESERCRHVSCVYVNNPTLTRDEFVHLMATQFGLSRAAAQSKAVFLSELAALLSERRQQGRTVALIVDEAQRLSAELLEEVRLLGNMETKTDKLLPLVLAGQPELAARLDEPALRQLKQRVSLRCELAPFTLAETATYIASRIRTAGGAPAKLFSHEAVRAIHEFSTGIARTINVICDNALVTGMALGRRPVNRAIVLDVCRDFALRTPAEPSVPDLPVTLAPSDAAVRAPQADNAHRIGSEAPDDRRLSSDPGGPEPVGFSLQTRPRVAHSSS